MSYLITVLITAFVTAIVTAAADARTITALTGQRDALRHQLAQRDLALKAATQTGGETE